MKGSINIECQIFVWKVLFVLIFSTVTQQSHIKICISTNFPVGKFYNSHILARASMWLSQDPSWTPSTYVINICHQHMSFKGTFWNFYSWSNILIFCPTPSSFSLYVNIAIQQISSTFPKHNLTHNFSSLILRLKCSGVDLLAVVFHPLRTPTKHFWNTSTSPVCYCNQQPGGSWSI